MRTARRQTSAARSMHGIAEPPPLENGDMLTATEFLRRYDAMPEVKKAELIDGIVYMGSPVRAKQHGIPDSHLQCWLVLYSSQTPGTAVAANSTTRFDVKNVPQPDAVLLNLTKSGRARIGRDGYIHGAPELVVEIAASSASIDLHRKLEAYRRAGVREYFVWRPTEAIVDWFALDGETYVPLEPDANGVLASRCFPGLVLDVQALATTSPGF